MARKLIVFLLIAGAAYFIYQRTNRVTSEEDQMVTNLGERYVAIVNRFTSAAGRSGAYNMATTSASETAVTLVLKLRTDLAELRQKLTEEKAISQAAELAEKIENFCKKNDIIRP